MRVLVVSESFLPQINGVTNSVRRVLEQLAAEGHVAELVAPTGPEEYAGFPVHHARGANLPFYKDFRLGIESRRRLRQVMLRFGPDVVHVASPASLGHQAIRAAADLGIPTVAIYQTDLVGFVGRYPVPGGAAAMGRLTRRIHRYADRTLAPSTASLTQLRRMGVGGLGHWPRGVDLELFGPGRRSPELRATWTGVSTGSVSAGSVSAGSVSAGLVPTSSTTRTAPAGSTTDGTLVVGYIGRLAAEKELELLTALDDVERIQLVLVGTGPEEERLRRLLPRAVFTGLLHGEELAAAYASLDVFVHTGRHETYCQAAQEALASGVPVVAPRSGGPIDVVAPGAGFLYEPGAGDELAVLVRRLRDAPLLRHRMSLEARRSVADRSWQSVNALLVEHYRGAVEDRLGQDRPARAAG